MFTIKSVENREHIYSPLNQSFNNGFKSIQKLILNNCATVENFGFLKTCVRLTHLNYEDVSSDGNDFRDIHLYLPQLKAISISYENIEKLIGILKHLEKLPNLLDLKIYCCYKDNECFVTTDNVIGFIDHCLSIRRITIHPKEANIDQTRCVAYIQRIHRKITFNTLPYYHLL